MRQIRLHKLVLEIVDNDDTGLTDEVAFKLSSEHLDWSLFKYMDGCLISKRLESYYKTLMQKLELSGFIIVFLLYEII